jgi:hypothetical protein
VPEQAWSSSAFLSAAIHGMLGLESEGRNNVLHFAPQIPPSWQSLYVEHVRVGKSVVDLQWHSENGHFTLDLRNAGPMFYLSWTQARTGHGGITPASLARDIMPGNTHLGLKIALTRRVPSNFKTMSASHFENFYTRQLADPMYSGSVGGGMVTVVRHFPRSLECCGADGSKAVALCFLRIRPLASAQRSLIS